jgi:DNA repair protein RecO (recombination protein O)
MPLAESDAVILRAGALGEADKLVEFFSRRFGRLRGVAPNARRSRRRFGAALEPLSRVQVSFFERESRELVRLSEAELVEAYWDARGDWERSVALNQIVELAQWLLPEREPAERAFRLLLAVLERMKRAESVWLPLTYYQLWMVRLSGWLPGLEQCSRCGKPLEDKLYVSADRGDACCPACRRPGQRALGAESRRAALEMLSKPLDRIPAEGWDRRRAAELQNWLLDVVEYHAEKKLVTRELWHEKG